MSTRNRMKHIEKELDKGRYEIYFCLYFLSKHFSYPILIEYLTSVYRAIAIDKHILSSFNGDSPEWLVARLNESIVSSCLNETDILFDTHKHVEYSLRKIYLTEFIPSIIFIYLLAMRSDSTGKRKIMIASPLLGHSAFTLGFVLDYHLQPGHFNYIYTGAFISGLLGGDGSVRVAMTSYVSDSTEENNRLRPLIFMEILRQLASSISSLAIANWIQLKGYGQVLWLNFGFSVLLMKLVLHLMSESNPLDRDYLQTKRFSDYFKSGSPRTITYIFKSWKFRMIWLSFISFTLLETGFTTIILSILEGSPMCVTPIFAWTIIGIVQFFSVLGLCIAIFLSKKFSANVLGVIGMLSCVSGFISVSFITQQTTLMISAILLLFHILPYPILLSSATKNISPSHRAMGLALLSIGEVSSGMLTQCLYPPLTQSTIAFRNAPILFIGLLTMIIPTLTFVYFIYKSDKKRVTSITPESESINNYDDSSYKNDMQSNITF